jgi:hypothetical protein
MTKDDPGKRRRTADNKKQAMLKFEQALLEAEEEAFPEVSKVVN